MDIQSRLVGAYTTCSRRKMAGYIRPSEHSPRRKLHPQLSRCSIDIALIMIGSCNFKAEEDTVHHHRVLRCKRDIARYWKPLVYHWQFSTGNCIIWDKYQQQDHTSAMVLLEDIFTACSFFLLNKGKGDLFKATNDWKPIPGPAELRPFVGTGRSGERISRTSN